MTHSAFRSDALRLLANRRDRRSPQRLCAHYELERRLAARLRAATPEERSRLYGEVYAELFASMPDHPQHTAQPENRLGRVDNQIRNIRPWLTPDAVFLEIGCGDAAMSFRVSPLVSAAYGLDVTGAMVPAQTAPPNFHFLLSDGRSVKLADETVDLAFSDQLMEHLHHDDAQVQLREILRVLKPGGRYWISTPSRLTGPHDISRYFAYEAQGFHLKEYDYASLAQALQQAGFRQVRYYIGRGGLRQFRLPTILATAIEGAMGLLPPAPRSRLTDHRLAALLFGINALAVKA